MSAEGEVIDGWDDATVADSTGSVNRPPVWQVGDRVRIVDGPPALHGAVGAVVEVDVPGRYPIRVAVEERRGFGEVLCAADELVAEGDGVVGGGAAS